MPSGAGFIEWLKSYGEIFGTEAVREGFVCGLAVGLVLPVGIMLLWWIIRRRRRKCRALRIRGEGGDLIISAVAVREFVQRIVAEFHELELLGVRLRRRKKVTDIRIRVNAIPGASIKLLKEALKDRVRAEAEEKMGLDDSTLGAVHVDVQKYSAREDDIEKKARKSARLEPASPASYPYVTSRLEPSEEDREGSAEEPSGGKGDDDGTETDDDTVSLC